MASASSLTFRLAYMIKIIVIKIVITAETAVVPEKAGVACEEPSEVQLQVQFT